AALHLAVGLHVAAVAAVVAALVLDDAHVTGGVVGRLLAVFLAARGIAPVAVALLELVLHAFLVAQVAQQAVVGGQVVVHRLRRIRGLVAALRHRVRRTRHARGRAALHATALAGLLVRAVHRCRLPLRLLRSRTRLPSRW